MLIDFESTDFIYKSGKDKRQQNKDKRVMIKERRLKIAAAPTFHRQCVWVDKVALLTWNRRIGSGKKKPPHC